MVAHALGDVISGDMLDPEVVVNPSPSVGGLLDSLTGSMGISSISARSKPVAAPVAASTTSGTTVTGAIVSDTPKSSLRPIDKDTLRSFITSSMPFGWYFLLWYFSSQISLFVFCRYCNLQSMSCYMD